MAFFACGSRPDADEAASAGAAITVNQIAPASEAIFTCRVAGTHFKATLAGATVENELSDGILQLFAVDEASQLSVELIMDDAEAKTGKTLQAEGGVLYLRSGKTYAIAPDNQATVVITARSATRVSGTFYFKAYEDLFQVGKGMLPVTEGRFDVEIGEE